jgi:hypothetical protein
MGKKVVASSKRVAAFDLGLLLDECDRADGRAGHLVAARSSKVGGQHLRRALPGAASFCDT